MGFKHDDGFDYNTIHPHFENMGWNEAPILEKHAAPSGELALWRRVITTAISDFCNLDKKPKTQFLQASAEKWLLENDRHFRVVCALADVNADRLRFMLRDFITLPQEARRGLKLRVTKL